MAEQLVTVTGVELCVETFGDDTDPAVLLISGLAASMDWWDSRFCERLAEQDRFVIRYDHRDTGRSEASPVGEPSYSSGDLTNDAIRVLEALDIAHAHIVGVSAGGGIVQELAVQHPDRVLTLTLIATSPAGTRADQRPLPPVDARLAATFENPPPEPAWDDPDAVVDYIVAGERNFAGSLGFDEERVRRVASTLVERTRDIRASMANHWLLIESGASTTFRLADIDVPTLVMHGTDDPLFPFGHGEALAADIPGATLVALEGMGHEVPPPDLWDVVVPAIARHTSQGAPRHARHGGPRSS
ncbi:alpha/beta hydrolase [Actinobacteria bacterium YIM 96077]|uniref:Alpha/beta hydrolase n=1 Tax=Phytoactinopolyspora halophila TaxID=1981511 RepID=A0A329QCL9_9ACTN|nr:alpha/beta hydrolase [Phytoactinopolyspora halophila]AYY13925.1 alpha/beta hydrolase [Actinobacteria bacterium YIM 96077]RAW10054.1 alpha/beta hydrolase [Phytoactinopolyspora halophila]